MNILDINKDITFKENTHQYFHKDGHSLQSVSRLLSSYKNKFDPQGHIIRAVAKRDKLTVEQVRQKWNKERDDACDRGHKLHNQLEYFINNKTILDDDYKDVVEQFATIKFEGKLFSEVQLYSSKFNIAGTTDLIELLDDNIVNIGDYKQNKKIDRQSKYKNKLLYPLDDFDECEFEIYTYQINLYSYMLKEHGYKTNKMTLYYFNPKTRIMEIFDIPKREKETLRLLKHFKKMQEW